MIRRPDDPPQTGQDYSYYVEQLKMHLSLFEHRCPDNDLDRKKHALHNLSMVQVNAAMATHAYQKVVNNYELSMVGVTLRARPTLPGEPTAGKASYGKISLDD